MVRRVRSINTTKLYIDFGVFLLFVVVSAPQATGVALHEWLSFILIPPLIVHLLLNWKWIVGITTKMFKRLPGATRFNYWWNLLLFIVMTLIIFSGIVISEAALPALGIAIIVDPFWSVLHDVTANLFFPLVGVHLAMNWKWLMRALKPPNRAEAAGAAHPTHRATVERAAIKKYFIPTLLILAAAAVVIWASQWMETTEWAEGIRASFDAQGEEGPEGSGDLGGMLLILPFIKEFVLMGIPGLLAGAVLWGIGLFKRRNRVVNV